MRIAAAICRRPTARTPGYSEMRIEQNRYRVSYRAANPADARRIEDFALLRAGQVTLNAGYDWFIVDQRNLDRGGNYQGPTATVGVGGSSWGGGGGVGSASDRPSARRRRSRGSGDHRHPTRAGRKPATPTPTTLAKSSIRSPRRRAASLTLGAPSSWPLP